MDIRLLQLVIGLSISLPIWLVIGFFFGWCVGRCLDRNDREVVVQRPEDPHA